MVRTHCWRYVFTGFIVALITGLLVSCAGTPKSSYVSPDSFDSSIGPESVTPSLGAKEPEEQSVTLIKPNLPPVEVINPERINLSYDKMELSPKFREIEMHYVYGDMLYASIIDMRENGNLLETEGVVTYNISSEETQILSYTEGNRIISFVVLGESVYYVSLDYGEENYKWSLTKSDLGFTEKSVLTSGDLLNPYLAPELVLEDDKVYLVSLDENNERGTSAISEVTGDNLRQIISIDSSEESLVNLTKFRVTDGYAYYMSSDETDQYVKKVDLATTETETLYTLPNSKGLLHGYMQTEKMLFVSSLDEVGGMIINIRTPLGETSYEFESALRREHVVQHGKIIVNGSDVFSILGETGELERRLRISEIDILPSYTVYGEDTLLVQDTYSGELYFCDIA